MAYGVLGFAVLHAHHPRHAAAAPSCSAASTRAVLVFGWPVLALCLLGLIETRLRPARRARAQARAARTLTNEFNPINHDQIKERRPWK